MASSNHQDLAGFIWNIANKLRGPYRPPQYRHVMLPMTILRRLDLVLEPTKDQVLAELERLKKKNMTGPALEAALSRVANGGNRKQALYNTSPFTFQKLLGDAPNIADNLISYIRGFSPRVRDIFEKFEFEKEIEKLDDSNRLFLIVKEFCSTEIDLSPAKLSNLQMGYLFEELVRKFNEQANEEAGDHFTPREVIRLMVELMFVYENEVFKAGKYSSIYDPTAGTGGMLSVAEEYIKRKNRDANIELFGQEYNPESYAICCSDLLIKDEEIANLVYGDTLGIKDAKSRAYNFVPQDGHPDKEFHFMLSNPPFGVEWKPEKSYVDDEAELGFSGRFGAGVPRINDGSLLFLQHMISKFHSSPQSGGDGSRIAIVFNGSPLFTSDAGSGESNIRRWIIENDWLDAVIALPDQMFYNTGIFTYVWIVTNKKPEERKGYVQLIDGTRHFRKMKKSMGNKRNELSDDHISELVKLYGNFRQNAECTTENNGSEEKRICSKIFRNIDFGYLKMTVERPLRLNFQASPERIELLKTETAFHNLILSKKKSVEAQAEAFQNGKVLQQALLEALQGMDSETLYRDRPLFAKALDDALKSADIKIDAPLKKAILNALGQRDEKAEICRDSKGNPEPDPELRDTELLPLPDDTCLPLPIGYDKDANNSKLLKLVQSHCEEYLKREVLPHVSDAWIDHSKTKVGYEIPLTRHFYVYKPPRPLEEIEADIKALEADILALLREVVE
ncbi:SAM-dependent DNA methyltransferase [Chlorobium sp. BLA1]|uniref:type I restriction-modification system subunit M n=1 Tax=Candidatus Chlorobium masyuteum TaxID=2716876 RepID=UPI00141EDF17|nr:class I SAM-dependent DNA methyltransferase [Candidatus Chlorobium masyuteum]NHQ60868.1 SAM-dependent DNA methyltransferase [Candidatus Chlorobium masyuteum]